jgi:hypothetical protein
MRRLLITLLVALAPASAAWAGVGSTHASGSITGPKGTCISYTEPSPHVTPMGTAILDSAGFDNGVFSVGLTLHAFPAGHYFVYLFDDQLYRGHPVGCASTVVGQLDVGTSGRASFNGRGFEMFQYAGQHYFEVMLCTAAPDAYPDHGYATEIMPLWVPHAHY